MSLSADEFSAIRRAIAAITVDAPGEDQAPFADLYAPASQAAALAPTTAIVLGASGSGKSFWAGALTRDVTRGAVAAAYPGLGLDRVEAAFGYAGQGVPNSVSADAIDAMVPPDADQQTAEAFWWAAILSAASRRVEVAADPPAACLSMARDPVARDERLSAIALAAALRGTTVLVVFDALDSVARTWPRRRLLTEALLAVVWAMRANQRIRLKLFLKPDQLDDEGLRCIELPKLRTGAVRLEWSPADLYGLFFARLASTADAQARTAFTRLLAMNDLPPGEWDHILTRRWPLASDPDAQARMMAALAGPFMGDGAYAHKRGSTYEWPLSRLGDARAEITPRAFLAMMSAAARYAEPPPDRCITADGIRHGLRQAAKTRVDELHREFPWIKGVLAPLAGLLPPCQEDTVYERWRRARTVERLLADAGNDYLPPFPDLDRRGEAGLVLALERIGVMSRRADDRLDMPDLFRVAARLLKQGPAPPA